MKLGRFKTGRVYTGDTGEYLYHVPPDCIDLTVTSPPYDNLREYNGYTWDFDTVARQLYRVTKPGGVVVWVVSDATVNGSETGTSFRQALGFVEIGFNLHDTMIYETDKPPMNDNRYQACFEYMFVFSKGYVKTFNPITTRALQGGRKRTAITYRETDGSLKKQWSGGFYKPTTIKTSIWYFAAGASKGTLDKYAFAHPATFPESLARDHIISWSNPGDVVFDPFAGSGTVAKMAELLGREHLGFEISQEYVNIAERRLAEIRLQPALLTAQQIEQQASGEPHESE